ncbi:hypothetical protein GQ42DRAFT_49730 [Ramicandelaber brevisporus]|nr:hypothetical protein GQ42DRAFT_49730 [Ramicandelaber brevisporus]
MRPIVTEKKKKKRKKKRITLFLQAGCQAQEALCCDCCSLSPLFTFQYFPLLFLFLFLYFYFTFFCTMRSLLVALCLVLLAIQQCLAAAVVQAAVVTKAMPATPVLQSTTKPHDLVLVSSSEQKEKKAPRSGVDALRRHTRILSRVLNKAFVSTLSQGPERYSALNRVFDSLSKRIEAHMTKLHSYNTKVSKTNRKGTAVHSAYDHLHPPKFKLSPLDAKALNAMATLSRNHLATALDGKCAAQLFKWCLRRSEAIVSAEHRHDYQELHANLRHMYAPGPVASSSMTRLRSLVWLYKDTLNSVEAPLPPPSR